jgi:hypothetical protein
LLQPSRAPLGLPPRHLGGESAFSPERILPALPRGVLSGVCTGLDSAPPARRVSGGSRAASTLDERRGAGVRCYVLAPAASGPGVGAPPPASPGALVSSAPSRGSCVFGLPVRPARGPPAGERSPRGSSILSTAGRPLPQGGGSGWVASSPRGPGGAGARGSARRFRGLLLPRHPQSHAQRSKNPHRGTHAGHTPLPWQTPNPNPDFGYQAGALSLHLQALGSSELSG